MITPKTFLMIGIVLTLESFACPETRATPFAGSLNISGSGLSPGGLSSSASFFDVAVDGPGTGAFRFLQTGTPVAIASPAMFLGSSTSTPSLWSVGGFTFELVFGNVISDPHQIKISGPATIFAPGIRPVSSGVEWTYTSRIGGTFTFQLISGTLVPDSGTTILFLGIGLVAIAVCRPKFAT